MTSNSGKRVGRLGYIGESSESSTSKQDFLKSAKWIQKEKKLQKIIEKLDKIEFQAGAFQKNLKVKMNPKRRELLTQQIGRTVFVEKDFFFAHEKRDKFTTMWNNLLQVELKRDAICQDTSDSAVPGSECFSLYGSSDRPTGNLNFYYVGEEKIAFRVTIELAQISAFFNNEETLAEFMVSDRYQNQISGDPLHASHLCHIKSCFRPLHLLYEFRHYNILRGSGQCCGWVYYIIDQKRVWEPSNACNHYPRCENVKEVAPKTFEYVQGMICVPI